MSNKVKLTEIVDELAQKADISTKTSRDFIHSLVNIIVEEAIENGKSSITNFGSFKQVDVAARTGVNPQTGEEIVIPAHQRLSFTPYKALEERVNAPFAHLDSEIIEEDSDSTDEKKDQSSSFNAPKTPPKEFSKSDEPKNSDTAGDGDDPTFDEIFNTEEDDDEPDDSAPVFKNRLDSFDSDTEEPESDNEPELDDDPFQFDETEEDEKEIETIDNAEKDEDEPKEPPVFRRAGKSKKPIVSPLVVIVSVIVVALVVLVAWFFISRFNTSPEVAVTPTPAEQNPVPEAQIQPVQPEPVDSEQEQSSATDASETGAAASEMPNEAATDSQPIEAVSNGELLDPVAYVVKQDEWIYDIARQNYGNPDLWPLIFQENYSANRDPDRVLPSSTINIPQVSGIVRPLARDLRLKLAEATELVASAYENAGKTDKANEYRELAQKYRNN